MDYLKKLNNEELEFMNQFMAEYVSGAFKKNENGDYSDENFHKTSEERKECYSRNNTRNRCGLTISNATGQTYRADDISSFLDSLCDLDNITNSTNAFSDVLTDEYNGDYNLLENSLLKDMMKDYERCTNPRTNADKKLSESNYGKMLISKFKDIKLV
jgi:hypothetical protein